MSDGWIEPNHWPALANGEVHIWLAHVPSIRGRLDEFIPLLSAEERERAARFRFPEHRERSQTTRGVLRALLGQYIGCPAHHIAFTFNAHGKPELPDRSVHFNTSHSGDFAAFAFTRAGAVGVDIEKIRADLARREQIAEKHFAPGERDQLLSLPDPHRARAFFDLWTRKEAFVKARGDGLFSGLNQFEVSLREPRVVSVGGAAAAEWWLTDLPDIPGYSGTVVVNTSSCSAKFWNYR